jgi:hypothetical protein
MQNRKDVGCAMRTNAATAGHGAHGALYIINAVTWRRWSCRKFTGRINAAYGATAEQQGVQQWQAFGRRLATGSPSIIECDKTIIPGEDK